jgi:hypothetical protein
VELLNIRGVYAAVYYFQITCTHRVPVKLLDDGLATGPAQPSGQLRIAYQGADFFGEIGIVSCLEHQAGFPVNNDIP